MSPHSKKPTAVREPIQVYLTRADRALLDRVSETAGLTRAEVLRRGLRQYGGAILGEPHPAVAFLDQVAAGPWPADMPDDVGLRHDEHLAAAYRNTVRKKARRKR
jgi:hypothetical protein